MKATVKRIIRDETGHAMELVLCLLAVGGLISASLLSFMGSGLLAGGIYETKTAELYAADAGVEDAVWKIQNGEVTLCTGNPTYSYNMTDVNGKAVAVNMAYVTNTTSGATYRVVSAATGADNDTTTVTAYTSASFLDYSGIMDYAITSNGNITVLNDCSIGGDVYIPDKDNLDIPKSSHINGTIFDSGDISITWPAFDQLRKYYWPDVSDLDPGDPTPQIIIPTWATSRANAFTLGPYLADVEDLEHLDIKSPVGNLWMRLEGTVYVKGNFFLEPAINLDLNGHTIFAEGTIVLSPTTTVYGSGCIIAMGNIDFQPELSCEEGQYVLVLSTEGTTSLQPDSDFQGTVAGDVSVEIQPGNELVWVSPYGRGLDFPMGEDEHPLITGVSISSWEVTQH